MLNLGRIFITVLLLLFLLGIPVSGYGVQSPSVAIRPNNSALAARGFDELYNMDYDAAIRDFTELQREHPDDPFTSNYLLAAEVFKELNRVGALDTEIYSSDSFLDMKARRALDADAEKRITDLIARVETLCNARLQRDPSDVDALYARGVARGFRSTYMGMAQRAWIAAIRAALASRRDHEHVLQLDPTYVDAKMAVGIHNYIIGSLNWAGRAAVALIGVTGNRQKGLEYLREVSRSRGTSSNDAALALSLFLRREQRYAEALSLVSRISHEYPRNYLLAVEYAHLLNAAGFGREAIAQYQVVLRRGREGRYSTFQPEIAAWGLGVSARGQREFEQAAAAFDLVTTCRDAQPALVTRAFVAAGEMYDMLDRRDDALARYRRAIANGRDDESVSAARKHVRHPFRPTQ